MAIRIVLIDDHHLLREALREKLAKESDIDIVGEAADGRAALTLIDELVPDIAVIDISLPEMNGIEIASRVTSAHANVRVIALSMHSDKRFVTEMFKAGASGYVTKTAAANELLVAIRAVAAGRRYVGAEVADALVDGVQADGQSQLGRREREVLCLLAEGLRTQDIADRLHISAGTVEVHRRNIMRKLDLHSVAELTRYAIREGIASL